MDIDDLVQNCRKAGVLLNYGTGVYPVSVTFLESKYEEAKEFYDLYKEEDGCIRCVFRAGSNCFYRV